MMRTPYSCSPYGERFDNYLKTALKKYVDKNYIICFQDVRSQKVKETLYNYAR